ncbi:carbohydrate ABC transporter membrane protein 1 (CUT1 family) [Humibacillus xanthopallidus]|uniref:Carbohydrate ABC transporter membrane protein 1 (CUT1 family) n=2 Tax=Humibacillus xanthopallidus TaxID=412689 RepID=A0A543HZN6_9MICO|nr:carbohydrate ABC transporter membrane protein 1 (CUT1 family) [Humibacillus xanthopallidus]
MTAIKTEVAGRTAAPPPRAPRRRAQGLQGSRKRAGWVMLAPALVHAAVFLLLPMVMLVALSFTDYQFLGAYHWVGIDNFVQLMSDDRWRTALLNTVLYTVVTVPIAMAVALLIALGLNSGIRARGAMRVLYYMPQVTATVAVATVWLWIYQPDVGLANSVLGLFGLPPQGWLTNPNLSLPSLMLVGVWQGLGAKMVVYLAALQSVSRDQLEAAQLDGANRWQTFWNVTWPALGPAHFFVFVTSTIASFQVFDLVFVMTKGGPGSSSTVMTYEIYENAFQGLQLGYAAAQSVVLVVLIGVFTLIGLRLQKVSSDV